LEIYLVGGAVRDQFLGQKIHDKDYVVLHTTPETFFKHFPSAKKVGKKEPVYIYKGDEYTLSQAQSIFEDLQQRDLTVNALAKTDSGCLIALPSSLHDLRHRILRQVSALNFYEDPLRVYRTARMQACYPEFALHPSLRELINSIGRTGLLGRIAPERIARETLKAFACLRPGDMFQLLGQTKTLSPWFQELTHLLDVPPRDDRHSSCFDALVCLMNDLSGGDPILVWMGLCQALRTNKSSASPVSGTLCFNGQAAQAAQTLGQRLRLPKRYIQAGEVTARWFEAGTNYPLLPAETRVDLLTVLNAKGLLSLFFEVVDTCQGSNYSQQAQKERGAIFSVQLPLEERNKGHHSGRLLKQLRCHALGTSFS
jgi:tRNA nucleotidyltransferase (CCA-adding enzyme)